MSTLPARAPDTIQEGLASYALSLEYSRLPEDVVHAAKVRLIDTLGVLLGGFFGEPCRVARSLAAMAATTSGATVLGTRMVTTPDLAAFANGTASRYPEYNDVYHFPGSAHGHPSDVIAPAFTAAEYAKASGQELLTGIVLAYQVYAHVCDKFKNDHYDNSNFCCTAGAVAVGRLMGLDKAQLEHCISMAVTPNNILRQVRRDHFTMWKEVSCGHAARSALFSAMMAKAGMEGPYLPFEGKSGWCSQVALGTLAPAELNGPFKILLTRTRHRPAMGEMHASIFASEKIGKLKNVEQVKKITVEVYKRARDLVGVGEQFWNPDTRETADHSIPYVVAAALMDGEITIRSFSDSRLWNPQLRALIHKIDVVENAEFTAAYGKVPREQRARVTVVMQDGQQLVGEAGGGHEDLAAQKSDEVIVEKFRGITEDLLGAKRVDRLLDCLWNVDKLDSVAAIPPLMVLD